MKDRRPKISTAQIVLLAAKVVCLALIVIFITRQFDTDKESKSDFATVESAVSSASDLNTMQPGDNLMVKRLYGVDPNAYGGVFFYYPTSNMGAEEVLLVKYSSPEQKEEILSAMQKRLDSQLSSFEGYGIEQSAMLKKAVIEAKGGYALFVSADDPDTVVRAFEGAL